ncbi:MAG: DUF4214 domain-containing protein [Pseudomonadota bacterium]
MRFVDGTPENDRLFLIVDEDMVFRAQAGNDTIFPGDGADSIDGGTGTDVVDYSISLTQGGLFTGGVMISLESGSGTVQSDARTNQHALVGIEAIYGSDFDDALTGDSSANDLRGNNGDDVISGLAGDDTIIAGSGADTLNGGADDDDLYVGEGDATVDGGSGVDRINFGVIEGGSPLFTNGATVDLAAGTASAVVGGQTYNYTLSNIEEVFGSRFADTVAGDDNANLFQTNNGDDLILGLGGDDIVFSGSGEDTVEAGVGDDSIFAMGGNATLDGGSDMDEVLFNTTQGSEAVFRFGVTANLDTGDARAVSLGQLSNFTLQNIENLTGSAFDDRLTGDNADNEISGLSGDDSIAALDGDDVILPGVGNDTIDGGDGLDVLSYATDAFDSGLIFDGSSQTVSGVADGQSFVQIVQNVESYIGTAFADRMLGGIGDETLTGGEGNDTIKGGEGDDVIAGNLGDDVALYDGAAHHFTYRYDFATAESQIIDRSTVEGTDTGLANTLRFSDRDWTVVADGDRYFGSDTLSESDYEVLVELYIAYFNRAPDAEGLYFWTLAFVNGTSLDQAAGLFFDQPETRALYGEDLDVAAFVVAVYQNVLGRGPDQLGQSFWVDALINGDVSEGKFIRDFLLGARADAPSDATPDFVAQQAADRAYLDAKTDIGIYFSTILGMSDLTNASDVMETFDGTAASLDAARLASDLAYQNALAADGDGGLLIQLVGLVDNPFEAL